MRDRAFQLRTVTVGDEPAAWARAGFAMNGSTTRIGSTTIVCDPGNTRGILHVHIDGLDEPIDGLPIGRGDRPPTPDTTSGSTVHPNQVTGFDHLVVMSPAIGRTSTALERLGLQKRRTRAFTAGNQQRRQDFFWLGDVILEVVGAVDERVPDGNAVPHEPAHFWGLALECEDLDAAAAALGDRLGRIKDAVQPGRRIATVRTRDLDVSVPIALMSRHLRSEQPSEPGHQYDPRRCDDPSSC